MLRPRSEQSERGAVAVIVAVMILPLALLVSFAIDTGWLWVHGRHLQTQVDAGSFAGGQGPWLPVCDDAAIIANATDYSGDAFAPVSNAPRTPVYNPQYTNESNVQVLINSSAYADKGGSDYSEDAKTPCQTLNSPVDANKPAYVDMKASESNLPLFLGSLPGFSQWNTFHAHARVQLEGQGGGDTIKPIAVRDDTSYVCAEARLVSVQSGQPVGSPITLGKTSGPPTTQYSEFQNTGGTNVTMPSTAESMYVRIGLFANKDPVTGACTGANEVFPTDPDGNAVGGVNFINVYSTSGPQGGTPALHSVIVSNAGCAPDQYFSYYTSNTTCIVDVVAEVEFPGAALARNPQVEINGQNATPNGSFTVWTANFSISPGSGPHTFSIRPRYNGCGSACQSMGIQQQAYSGIDDDGQDSSSGPISMLQIGEGGPSVGANSFRHTTTHNLVFTLRLNGLANSLPSDPPIVLRYRNQASKRTGLVDCGQGNGANADEAAIINGCPRPLYIWTPGTPCVEPDNSPAGTPIDCVGNTPGNRTQKIPGAIRTRVGNSCNHWNAYRDSGGTTTFPPDDPRAITVLITSPADLSGKSGSQPSIPILLFATLYVTGADRMTGNGTDCQNEPYPGPGNNDQAAIWGHWIKWADGSGTGTGKSCKPNEFGNCVAVLTK